ncbi:MAG: DEAD/DEAH box helicase [Acidimicrobiales bacterium]
MTDSFRDLGVDTTIADALEAKGIATPFPIQRMTIPDSLAGRDVCGRAKTGSGKTLAFGIPLVQRATPAEARRPTGIVLVPTRELALQVYGELKPLAATRDLTVVAIYGGASMEDQITALAKSASIVVATPGRLIDLVERKEVSLAAVDKVVVDEADRMADMGFLPQVEWLLRQIDGRHQTLLFSATLDGVVSGLIRRYQTDPAMHELDASAPTVEQLHHRFITVHEMDKVKVAAEIARASKRTIIFVRTKFRCDKVAERISALGVDAQAIHGDLRQTAREKVLNKFTKGDLPVLVATDVAARGIHVDDVETVIHYDPPDDHKSYLHRSGRTARAGDTGVAVTLVLWNEELDVKRLQSRLGLDLPLVEMFSNDERLKDLVAWDGRDSVT